MKIRLICSPAEVEAALDAIRAVFDVLHVSRPYPCRDIDSHVRVYVEVEPR